MKDTDQKSKEKILNELKRDRMFLGGRLSTHDC